MIRSYILATTIAAATLFSTPLVLAKDATWDGTWSGRSSAGGNTTVRIQNGKVTAWTNNGFPRARPSGSASGNTVKLDDNNGCGLPPLGGPVQI